MYSFVLSLMYYMHKPNNLSVTQLDLVQMQFLGFISLSSGAGLLIFRKKVPVVFKEATFFQSLPSCWYLFTPPVLLESSRGVTQS